MFSDHFRDLGISETWILSDHCSLIMLTVKDESYLPACQQRTDAIHLKYWEIYDVERNKGFITKFVFAYRF